MADESKTAAKPEQKDNFLSRFSIRQAGKEVKVPVSDNYTVQAASGAEITKGERPAILKELKTRYPDCAFTWIG